jgi:hypothetical protein
MKNKEVTAPKVFRNTPGIFNSNYILMRDYPMNPKLGSDHVFS